MTNGIRHEEQPKKKPAAKKEKGKKRKGLLKQKPATLISPDQ